MRETAEAFAREVDVGNPTGDGNKCINDYFVKKGMHEIAEAFTSKADIKNPTNDGKSFFKFMADLNSLLCFNRDYHSLKVVSA